MPQNSKNPNLPAPLRAITAISGALARAEKAAASALIGAVALLILLNVFTRYFDYALYWVDETAIYAMVWATLIAGSLCLRQRALISVTLVQDMVPVKIQRVMTIISDVIVVIFGGYAIWMSWIWFSPLEFARTGFDVGTFVIETGNFIYGEPTNTLGISKFWLWLIMPIFAISVSVHGLANLIESISGTAPPPQAPSGEVLST